jgi:hypothetical protein
MAFERIQDLINMQFWDQIIHTALLGTDKKAPGEDQLPPVLAEAAASVRQNNAIDKEEQFLQTAALAFSYRQCGVRPLHKEGLPFAKAAAEEKKYCSVQAMQVLKDILDEESMPLLHIWLQQCMAKERVVTPDFVPVLLNKGILQKKLQPLIAASCGKRGEWLSRFNNEWNFSTGGTDSAQWHTGTPEQRKYVLQQLRQADPAMAREWLQQTWPQEDAATKTELLALLAVNISDDDIAFLETLSSEKSKKVKELALQLLKRIPQSSIVQQYQQVLQQAVRVVKEKALLGLISKTYLSILSPENMDPGIFKTGIDKLSNTKDMSDGEYVVYQLIRSVPPGFWETHLQSKPETIIQDWQKDEAGKKLLPALVGATVTYNDHNWARAFVQNSQVFYIDLIPMLPIKQQEYYSLKFFEQYADSIIEHALQREDEWSPELTRHIIKHAAKNPYQYSQSFYNQHIQSIPAAIAPELESLAVMGTSPYSNWNSTCNYIRNLINLKTQTVRSFNE